MEQFRFNIMNTRPNRMYAALKAKDDSVVYSHVTALNILGYFSGYGFPVDVDYYASEDLNVPGSEYHPGTVDASETESFYDGWLVCTNTNRTFEDVLLAHDSIDDAVICESLNDYYFSNGKTFDGLVLSEEARRILKTYEEDAIAYA